MEQESGSNQVLPTAVRDSAVVYDTLVHSILAGEYETTFLNATGLSLQLVPTDNAMMLFGRKANTFCRLMTQSDSSCSACKRVHEELQRRVADSLAPQTICCFAGLAEFAVPIVVNGEHAATLIGGQVFQRKPTQAQFARLARKLRRWGLQSKLERFKTQFFRTRVSSPKQFQASLQLLLSFTKLLEEDISRSLLKTNTHEQPCITTAKNFILAHASEPIRLRDAAEHLHVSIHYFCKFFKKATGVGFSEFLGRARVENAKQVLADATLPISEVANQTGFGSLSQFNRTFHRYAGCSPKQYRASLRQTSSL